MEKDSKGKFTKGNSGRPKGSKNKSKVLSNNRIAEYFKNEGFDELLGEIKLLEGKDKVTAQLKLLEFVMPRQKAVDMTASVEDKREDKTIEEMQKELEDIQRIKNEEAWKGDE